jgi:hypothetical protein
MVDFWGSPLWFYFFFGSFLLWIWLGARSIALYRVSFTGFFKPAVFVFLCVFGASAEFLVCILKAYFIILSGG